MKTKLLILDNFIEKMSSFLLILSMAMILFLSLQGIVLRWFDISFPQVGPFIRHLVFLSTFLGGVIATGRKNHIGIDVLSKFLEAKKLDSSVLIINRAINFISFCTIIWLIFSSVALVRMEAEFGKVEFFGIHSKFLIGIIPFGFSLIAYRFLFLFIDSFYKKEV